MEKQMILSLIIHISLHIFGKQNQDKKEHLVKGASLKLNPARDLTLSPKAIISALMQPDH